MGLGSFIKNPGRVALAIGTGGGSEVLRAGMKMFGGGGRGGGGFNGGPKIPDFAMRKTSEFERNNPNIQIGGPNARQDLQKAFSGMKELAVNKANAGLQGQSNALQRRFSAMGASGSGAQIKALQLAHDAASKQASDAATEIGASEVQAFQNHDLAQADMDFKQRVFNFEQGSKLHELDLAERQQKIDAASTEYNRRLSQFQAQPPKEGLISRFLGGIL